MDINEKNTAARGFGPDASQMVVSPRSGKLGFELARDVILDPRVKSLSLQALGALMRIKAHEEAMQPLAKNVSSVCRALGVQSRTYHSIIKELKENAMGIALVYEDDKFLRANPFGKPILASTLRARVEAGKKRQSVPSSVSTGKSQASPGAGAEEKPAKAPRKSRKSQAVKATFEAGNSAFSPALGGAVHDAASTVDEGAAGPLAPSAPVAPVTPQLPVQFDLLGDAVDATGKPLNVEDEEAIAMRREAVPYGKICNLFNQNCKSLPSVKPPAQWSHRRKHDVMMRWREHPSLEFWEKFFQSVEISDFLSGRASSFRGSFDWLMNATNFLKINEGNYSNRGGSAKLFGGGNSNFKVGTYGDHDVAEGMPWSPKSASSTPPSAETSKTGADK